MRRWGPLLGVLALVVLGDPSGSAWAHDRAAATGSSDTDVATSESASRAGRNRVDLGVCDMSVGVVRETEARLRRFVPASFELGRSLYTLGSSAFGLVVIWTMDCDGIGVPSSKPRRAIISIVAIQLETPGRPTSVSTIANMFDLYSVGLHTDDQRVARWLRKGGMPAQTAPIRVNRTRQVNIVVPTGRAGYSVRLNPLHADPVGVHTHANAFWHDGPGRPVRLGLDIPQARDLACIQLVGLCGTLDSGTSSPVTRMLGHKRRQLDFVFDHVGLESGSLSLSRPKLAH